MSKVALKMLGALSISLMIFTACSSKEETTTTTEEETTTTADETVVVEDEGVMVADAPEGCPKESTLTVKSEEAGEVTFDANHAWYLDWDSLGWGSFYFQSYDDFDPQNYSSHEFVAGDVTAGFDLKTLDGSEPTVGTWNYRADGENNALTWLNISTIDLAGGVFDEKGKVEITYMGDDYVCGKVTADDGSSSMNGEFIAKYHNWKF